MSCIGRFFSLSAIFAAFLPAGAQTPEWIWSSSTAPEGPAQVVYFRKTFRTPALTWNARLAVTADDEAEIFLNGVSVAKCPQWDQPVRTEVSTRLNQGENVIAVLARNRAGKAGLLVQLNLNGQTNLVSDTSWLASTNAEKDWTRLGFNAAHWKSAESLGKHGIEPWGEILFRPAAIPADSLKVADGFKVELLHSAATNEGSWICMTFDDKGRVIVSPQGDSRPLLRLTLTDGKVTQIEPISAPVRDAMGLLFAHESFYANARGPSGPGLYRLIDENHNDQFETNEVHFLKRFDGGSEHGYHALALGPDKKIYAINGNGTKLPEGLSATSPYRHYGEDMLTTGGPEQDQDGAKAPACYVVRCDPDGSNMELFCGGMRNAYDFDFNADGELFTFDSDMEWDWGTAWYRPTRVLHLVSGGEYGWRDGLRMWPDWYPDTLPPVTYIGIGSPTGVKFGTRSNFPKKYKNALFVMDWSYGRILAVRPSPAGPGFFGYEAAGIEPFLQGQQLNLTSLAFGPDGAMYFITGGRGTQSGLYRVSYKASDAPALPLASVPLSSHARLWLTVLHTRKDPSAIKDLWHYLGSEDRFVRFSARVALENQDVNLWRDMALRGVPGERPVRGIPYWEQSHWEALLALARVSRPEDQGPIIDALLQVKPYPKKDFEGEMTKLRVLEVALARGATLDARQRKTLLDNLSSLYPAKTWLMNRELSRLLVYLKAADVVHKTMPLLEKAKTQEEQTHYISILRQVREGWTPEARRRYFSWWIKPRDPKAHPPEVLQWFKDVGREYVDGAYFDRYLRDLRRDAVATLTPEERQQLATLIDAPFTRAQSVPASNRQFVKEWKMSDFVKDLDSVPARAKSAKNLASGKQVFVDAQCLSCHRFGNDGGIVGPELTAAGSKYSPRDLLESILDPSKVINEQYQNHTVWLKDGDTLSGRLVSQTADQVLIETDRIYGAREKFPADKVAALKPSALSPMPSGLANVLTKEEVLDLLAYLSHGMSQ